MNSSIVEKIRQLAKQELSDHRYQHTLRVVTLMHELGRRFGLNNELISIAGWAHDIAKEWDEERLKTSIILYQRQAYLHSHPYTVLWHGLVAMPYITERLDYYNQEVDTAIIHHTTASPQRHWLSQLLYVADSFEPGRSYLQPIHLAILKTADLTSLTNLAIAQSVNYLQQNQQAISPITQNLYNSMRNSMQKQLKSFHQNPFKENTYLFFIDETLLVIDPGVKIEYLASAILAYQPKQAKILYTHGHFDHIIYGHALEQFFTEQAISYSSYAPKKDQFYFTAEGYQHILKVIADYGLANDYTCEAVPTIDHFLTHEASINCSDFIFYETPGHTAGSGIFYSEQAQLIFGGDTIFANGSIGRTDFPDSSPQAMEDSLRFIFEHFPTNTIIYTGHGMATTLEKELKYHANLL